MTTMLLESLWLACLGVVLALLVRQPLRRLTGAGPAFCVWLAPLLMMLTPWLPAGWGHGSLPGRAIMTLPAMLAVPGSPATAVHAPGAPWWLLVWATGCALMLLRLAWYSACLMIQTRVLPDSMAAALAADLHDRDVSRLRLHAAGPAAVWGWRCRILLPADFHERFDRDERAAVLDHEFTHLRRADPWWSLAAALTLVALWFFPLAWFAMSRFRLDQELACDDAVLRDTRQSAGAYARTLLDSHHAHLAIPAVNAWLAPSQLKARLAMIHRYRPRRWQRAGGYTALAVLLAGTALVCQAALPPTTAGHATRQPPAALIVLLASNASTQPPAQASPARNRNAAVDVNYRKLHPPRYPPEAKAKHEQGDVVLLIEVGTRGQALRVKLDHSSGFKSLDQAAMAAAKRWHFTPSTRAGTPVRQWLRIPVHFRLKLDLAPADATTALHSRQ